MADDDFRMSAVIGDGITICGIGPKRWLVTTAEHPCWNCGKQSVLRRFSGSGWYEDDYLCAACGEDVGTGYRPFQRAWRKANIERADLWANYLVSREEFFETTGRLIREEMGWDDGTAQAAVTEGSK